MIDLNSALVICEVIKLHSNFEHSSEAIAALLREFGEELPAANKDKLEAIALECEKMTCSELASAMRELASEMGWDQKEKTTLTNGFAKLQRISGNPMAAGSVMITGVQKQKIEQAVKRVSDLLAKAEPTSSESETVEPGEIKQILVKFTATKNQYESFFERLNGSDHIRTFHQEYPNTFSAISFSAPTGIYISAVESNGRLRFIVTEAKSFESVNDAPVAVEIKVDICFLKCVQNVSPAIEHINQLIRDTFTQVNKKYPVTFTQSTDEEGKPVFNASFEPQKTEKETPSSTSTPPSSPSGADHEAVSAETNVTQLGTTTLAFCALDVNPGEHVTIGGDIQAGLFS